MENVDSLVVGLYGSEVEVCASPLVGGWPDLFPEERTAVANAVEKRVRAFATGRVCARRLLARFGVRDAILPAASDGRPEWPTGFVGSISHANDLCVVAVAKQAVVASVGIDVEADRDLEEHTWDLVCTPAEMQWVGSQTPTSRGSLVTALFSVKEAVHKCTSTPSAPAFEPRCIAIDWDGTSPVFRASIGNSVNPRRVAGRIARRDGWIFSAVQLPRNAAHSTSRRLAPTSAGSKASKSSGT